MLPVLGPQPVGVGAGEGEPGDAGAVVRGGQYFVFILAGAEMPPSSVCPSPFLPSAGPASPNRTLGVVLAAPACWAALLLPLPPTAFLITQQVSSLRSAEMP